MTSVANNKLNPISIQVGSTTVTQESNAKLLGIVIDENQEWTSQISGQGDLISALNSRLFLIRRLNNYIGKPRLMKLADSLFTSIYSKYQLLAVVLSTCKNDTFYLS